ncbi:MAG: zinc-ribbon domain-containing protein [Actinomycetota bacterium]|nr:zinc-ribbon domain-containing protein [Actinomycetota bacterium]
MIFKGKKQTKEPEEGKEKKETTQSTEAKEVKHEEIERCVECGKILKDKTYEPYCKQCDEKLDKQFDSIEDNILIYRELLDSEIKILEKFDDEDIKDLFKKIYEKFSKEEGGLKEESVVVLNKFKNSFGLNELEMGLARLPDIKEIKKNKPLDECPECSKKIKEDFNLCPYCGYRLKDNF